MTPEAIQVLLASATSTMITTTATSEAVASTSFPTEVDNNHNNNHMDATTTTTNTLALHSHMDFIALARLLRDESNRQLEILSLYKLDMDFNVAAEIVDHLQRWRQVILVQCDGDHLHHVIAALFRQPTIQQVSLCGGRLDLQVVDAIGRGLQYEHSLVELSLTVDMPSPTTLALCQGMNSPGSKHLRTLDLSQCDFGADAIAVLCQGFANNQQLQSINLEHCRLEDFEVADLVQSLREHPSLQELSVRMNYCEQEAVEAMADLLTSPTSKLQRLDMAQQDPGVLDLAILARALRNNTTLQFLDLRENFVYDAHMACLADALCVNTTLKELYLENCDIGDLGWHSLLDRLPEMHGIRKLWLRMNRFQKSTVNDEMVLEQAIRCNSMLHVLDLDPPMSSSQLLQYYLCLNRGGRQCLSPNSIPLSLWPILLERTRYQHLITEVQRDAGIIEADILYCLLHGPALLER